MARLFPCPQQERPKVTPRTRELVISHSGPHEQTRSKPRSPSGWDMAGSFGWAVGGTASTYSQAIGTSTTLLIPAGKRGDGNGRPRVLLSVPRTMHARCA